MRWRCPCRGGRSKPWSCSTPTLRAKRGSTVGQIYARQLLGQLRGLHRCAVMMAAELKAEGVDREARGRLRHAISAFDRALLGAKDARDMLEHFDEYARGKGNLAKDAIA